MQKPSPRRCNRVAELPAPTGRNATLQWAQISNTAQQVLYVDGRKVLTEPLSETFLSDQVTCGPAHLVLAEADGDWHYDKSN